MAQDRTEPQPIPPLSKDMARAFDPWGPKPEGSVTMSGMAKALEEHRQTGGYKRIGLGS